MHWAGGARWLIALAPRWLEPKWLRTGVCVCRWGIPPILAPIGFIPIVSSQPPGYNNTPIAPAAMYGTPQTAAPGTPQEARGIRPGGSRDPPGAPRGSLPFPIGSLDPPRGSRATKWFPGLPTPTPGPPRGFGSGDLRRPAGQAGRARGGSGPGAGLGGPRGSPGAGLGGPGAGRAGRAPGRVVCSIARLHERGRMRGSPRDTAEGYDKHKTINIFHYSIFMGNVNPP